VRTLDREDLKNIAAGAALLGTGGGGNPYLGRLVVEGVLTPARRIRVADAGELPPETRVAAMFGLGAPTVGIEKIRSGAEALTALRALERYVGYQFGAIAPIEMGGSNSMIPLALAAVTDLPVLDLDGMGRAFPEVQMVTYSVYGVAAGPMAVADERGNVAVMEALDDRWMERMARAVTVAQGGHADAVGYPSTVGRLREVGIGGTLTLAESIGRILRTRRRVLSDLLPLVSGGIVFEGKIVDLKRHTMGGFARGEAALSGTGPDAGLEARLIFQNENLALFVADRPVVTVPDLITLLDYDSSTPLTTEVLRYGWRVRVLAMPCHDLWRTPEALAVAGPRAFGYDFDFQPWDAAESARSVP
jgi:DUF917 family protein